MLTFYCMYINVCKRIADFYLVKIFNDKIITLFIYIFENIAPLN